MTISLAPMEGVIDASMRRMLSAIGGYNRCVTEFIRVTNSVVPTKVFHRLCPELMEGGRTKSGTPVYIQLLGSDHGRMAKSAAIGVRAGALGVDLNFGCPAKIVNRHNGGSALLKEPSKVGEIVDAVRQEIDPAIPVCAKIRLGFDHANYLSEIVERIADAGANELCIHARTRTDGYKPPAYWHFIGELAHPKKTELIVNGEIWTVSDARNALSQSRCRSLMLGRGGLAQPDLAHQIQQALSSKNHTYSPMSWQQVLILVEQFYRESDSHNPKYAGNRTKQWLGYLRKQYAGANQLFVDIKRLRGIEEISTVIYQHQCRLDLQSGCERDAA
ncbi:MAG: tRNA-dihydrouridine synthase [Acidiferrobacterales bacterium]|nr:tRNA-dihydrouridine synthase [Acidiferrobacterales bacterium]